MKLTEVVVQPLSLVLLINIFIIYSQKVKFSHAIHKDFTYFV